MDADKIKIANEEVHLDPKNLEFNEATLVDYLKNEASWYNNFGAKLARAEYLLQSRELEHERIYAEKFRDFKDDGGSDNLCKSKAECDNEVVEAKEKVIKARFKVKLLQQHLRAWDKNHENAQSLGHMLRKEMDKLNADSFMRRSYGQDVMGGYEQAVDDVITHVDPEDHS